MEKCAHNGCGAPPMQDSEFCYWHNPGTEAERKAASSRGGKASRRTLRPEDVARLDFSTLKELDGFLAFLIKEVSTGGITVGAARAAGYLARSLVQIRESGEFEQRLISLERRLTEMEKGR